MCLSKFDYSHWKAGTRSLKRHLEDKHPKVASAGNAIATVAPAQQTLVSSEFVSRPVKRRIEIPILKKCILTLACSHHILPLQFFEDSVVLQGFGLPCISWQDVCSELRQMAVDIKNDLMESLRGKWATLILDGWKNPVTQRQHLTVLLFF